ncbi:MAG: permease [Fibrobacterales bacterium]
MFEIFTEFADLIAWRLIALDPLSSLGSAVHFFIEDTSKILVLLVVMIYCIAIVRASLNLEWVRNHLQGRSRWFGYGAGSLFGAITPFCSCSSIPMFLGFTTAGIPTGVTLSFLITSPLLNEVALVLLASILGWEFALVYGVSGLIAGVLGGVFFDSIGSDKYLQPLVTNLKKQQLKISTTSSVSLSLTDRHQFAVTETKEILQKIWKWVFIGVGIGALLHGYIPEGWIASHLGSGSFWSVPVAVLLGIPLYSNASGMIPVIESLLAKGLPVGTALALMMSTVGASFPEFLLLRQVLQLRLLVYLFIYFLIAFSVIGWIINIFF